MCGLLPVAMMRSDKQHPLLAASFAWDVTLLRSRCVCHAGRIDERILSIASSIK
jgi:hypothetical protein